MSRGTIEFYFGKYSNKTDNIVLDIVSPFSYVAFEALLQYEKQLHLKINFKPVSIIQLFQGSGKFQSY